MRLFVSALLALNLALVYGAPSNQAEVVSEQKAIVSSVGEKGDARSLLDAYANDEARIKVCTSGVSCEFTTVGKAKMMADAHFSSVSEVKAEENFVTKALAPSMVTMAESLKTLAAQKLMLEQLEAKMAELTSASTKGQELAESTKGLYAETMTKGIQFSPPQPTKGLVAAPQTKGFAAAPQPKGYAMPPSKGASSASSMQYEAMMCPMTMFELGKSQKLAAERKLMLEAATAANAQMAAEKQRLENALAASEMMRIKAQEQADFNAKYAAEQKAKAEMMASALNTCTVEKAMVQSQKEHVEQVLAATQQALSEEKAAHAACQDDLALCTEEKEELTRNLDDMTARAVAAEEELAATKARLEEEIDRAITCEETLAFTQKRLAKSEEDLNNERRAREETEAELMKTMTDLSSCQRETRVVNELLSRTQDELQATTAALARETAAREALEAKVAQITEQLRATEQELRDCQRALEDEQNAHATTQRILNETREELEASEAARAALEEANNALTAELDETKQQLEEMTAERDLLQQNLDATNAALAEMTMAKMTCEAALSECNSLSEQLASQLNDALEMLTAEKKAREELTATIAIVQETSMKVQEEVKKLQLENLQLQQQVQKLQNEQEVALALAAGCPPTYEKFGSSCYKYVREKTQWKMAQEQCMKDQGNLVAIENTEEQIFLTNYLKRHGANDAYAFTSGNKQPNGWKWLGAANNHMDGKFWYNLATQTKMGYDCQAMYLYDPMNFGKWVGLPCYNSAPFICEYNLVPHDATMPSNPAEQMAILEMAQEAPVYLRAMVRH